MSSFELTGLVPARILKRYKRFLADVELECGKVATAHCTNTGAMSTCWEPGDSAQLLPSQNPARKLPYTWIACCRQGTWVGVETGLPNKIVSQWLREGSIPSLGGLSGIRTEVPYGAERSRIDVWGVDPGGRQTFIEVKNATMRCGDAACFPDAKTERGVKHLRELQLVAREGHRAVILFFINRNDVGSFATARHIDPIYADELDRAVAAGVEVLPLLTGISAEKSCDGTWSLRWGLEKELVFDSEAGQT